ncbi:sugar transferase [Candidatus Peregrinibacteria bacterium]|jgi:exopolysaccharide biosynthesis polyprenyl glycosylphosphotransferase|nr:sugar transferase [Candidatus Peregrinibacteria bacterium]
MRPFIRIIDQKGLAVIVLILTDMLGYLLSFLIAYHIRSGVMVEYLGYAQIQPFNVYIGALPAVFMILLVVFYTSGLYERKNRINGMLETYHILRAVTFCWLMIMAASFLAKYDYSRVLVMLFWLISLFVLTFGRLFVRHIKLAMIKRGMSMTRVIIVGAGRTGRKLKSELESYKHFGYEIIGFVDDNVRLKQKSPFKLLGKTRDMRKLIKGYRAHEVFISDPAMSYESILGLMHQCEETDVRFKVVSGLFEIVSGGIDISEIEGIPSLDMRKTGDNLLYLFSKRLMDIIGSIIGIIIFMPLWVILGIAIKVDSSGPVLFKHERVGIHGKGFMLWKFRTMHHNVRNQEYAPKNLNDKRVTRVGRFLRKTSLDEVPQFWNVLKGEMSIVGPRPEMPFIVKKYTEWQKRRLDVKPGITGLWQILGRKDLPLHENIEYDFYYIKNRSLFLDLVIILKTFTVILTGKGAY